jgi:ketosteroid isomerase-like protein
MSQENVEIVRRIIEAAQRGDWDAAMRDYDQAVILDQRRMPGGGVYHGHEGVREFYGRWFGAWDDLRIETERLIDAGDHVVDINEISGRGRSSGVAVKMRSANVWTITRGKVVSHVGYPVASDALEAAGLRE